MLIQEGKDGCQRSVREQSEGRQSVGSVGGPAMAVDVLVTL